MFSSRVRPLGVASAAFVGVASLGIATSLMPGEAGPGIVTAAIRMLNTEAWVMGGSGTPIPPPAYIDAVMNLFIDPQSPFEGQPVFPVDSANGLVTPEGLYPTTGVKSLPVDTSISQGVAILNNTIDQQMAAGNNMVVFGYSQSSVIASQEMNNLLDLPAGQQPSADQLSFVLIGDVSNPNGGLFSRFDVPGLPLTAPSLGLTFSGATPSDTPWDTAIYSAEYDGFSDFPKYPLNLISDINALLGSFTVHGSYPGMTPAELATAIPLDTSDDYTGHTHYFMIPTNYLPILEPLLGVPVIGQSLYDLLEPDMRILVNLGYGNINYGWDQGPANVATPFGVFPDVNINTLLSALGAGAQQGIDAFDSDLSHLSIAGAASAAGNAMAEPSAGLFPDGLPSLSEFVNTFTYVTSTAYATLLPTADIMNALFTTVPAYQVELFFDELNSGNLVDALGMPLAAGVGLDSFSAALEIPVLMNAFSGITGALDNLFFEA